MTSAFISAVSPCVFLRQPAYVPKQKPYFVTRNFHLFFQKLSLFTHKVCAFEFKEPDIMAVHPDHLEIRATIEVAPGAVQAVVDQSRKIKGKKGDTADLLYQMISKFLAENDFESYVKNPDNYT